MLGSTSQSQNRQQPRCSKRQDINGAVSASSVGGFSVVFVCRWQWKNFKPAWSWFAALLFSYQSHAIASQHYSREQKEDARGIGRKTRTDEHRESEKRTDDRENSGKENVEPQS